MKRMVIIRSDAIHESDSFEEINIEDESWVLEVTEGVSGWVTGRIRRCELVGVSLDSMVSHITAYSARVSFREGYDATQTTLYVALKPFGAIIRSSGINGSDLRFRFEPAREIHKGELGQNVPVEMPRFVHEPGPDQRIWANLVETARLADMDPLELLQRYYRFDNFDSSRLWLSIGDRPGRTFKLERKAPAEYPRVMVPSGLAAYVTDSVGVPRTEASRLWITGELAASTLYLRHFDYPLQPVL
ncbi:MAG: hypothetical protein ABIB04_01950 [Patescibacteria group bacterium]